MITDRQIIFMNEVSCLLYKMGGKIVNSKLFRKIICVLLTLIFLCAGWLAVSSFSTHECTDCSQVSGLCPHHAKLAEELQQFRITFSFAPYMALLLLLIIMSHFSKELYPRTLTLWKVRLNS